MSRTYTLKELESCNIPVGIFKRFDRGICEVCGKKKQVAILDSYLYKQICDSCFKSKFNRIKLSNQVVEVKSKPKRLISTKKQVEYTASEKTIHADQYDIKRTDQVIKFEHPKHTTLLHVNFIRDVINLYETGNLKHLL